MQTYNNIFVEQSSNEISISIDDTLRIHFTLPPLYPEEQIPMVKIIGKNIGREAELLQQLQQKVQENSGNNVNIIVRHNYCLVQKCCLH